MGNVTTFCIFECIRYFDESTCSAMTKIVHRRVVGYHSVTFCFCRFSYIAAIWLAKAGSWRMCLIVWISIPTSSFLGFKINFFYDIKLFRSQIIIFFVFSCNSEIKKRKLIYVIFLLQDFSNHNFDLYFLLFIIDHTKMCLIFIFYYSQSYTKYLILIICLLDNIIRI